MTRQVLDQAANTGSGSGGGGAVTVADGADVTQGAKADARSTATDTTPITVVSILKEISFMEQNPASRAVTNAGTFAVQAAQSGTWTVGLSASQTVGVTNLPTTVDTNSGVKSASTLRVVLATDQPAFTTAMPVSQADGADVTMGAKVDAAATDSTSSWSLVALLKGTLAQMLSTAPAQTYRSDPYFHIAAGTATNTVKSGAGTLSAIRINTKGASANTITVYDSLSGSGTVIAIIDGTSDRDHPFDAAFAIGLTIVSATGTGADMTVFYR